MTAKPKAGAGVRLTPPTGPGWMTTRWKGGRNAAGGTVFDHEARVRHLDGQEPEGWFFMTEEDAATLRRYSASTKTVGPLWIRLTPTGSTLAKLLAQARREAARAAT